MVGGEMVVLEWEGERVVLLVGEGVRVLEEGPKVLEGVMVVFLSV